MEKGGNSGNIGARKPILALGELLVDLVPGREGMRIEDAGPVVKTASGSAGIFACAATLLGGRGGFIGKVGRDSLSRMVAGTLRGQGVDLSRLIVSDEGQMGLAFLEYLPEGRNYQYYRKNSVGSLLRASELDAEYISGAYAVHFVWWRSRGRRGFWFRSTQTSAASFQRMRPHGRACCGRCAMRT